MFNNTYKGKNVFITGHTGFKGSWLALWLRKLGANVTGYSLPPAHTPNHFDLLDLDINSQLGDIRKMDDLAASIKKHRPEIVFHLAAQTLVRYSYEHPRETFETNVMGTVNVFEACRASTSVRAIVNITSDKCYENRETIWGYRETDPMGGRDPYSCSKGCAELATAAYRASYFLQPGRRVLVATARAGNVIGGGDWARDRLVPDLVEAAAKDEKTTIRNPRSIRPWQHVLEPLSGYLSLGEKLLDGKKALAAAWNFGPGENGNREAIELVEGLRQHWERISYQIAPLQGQPHEAHILKLDCSKARAILKWRPVWDLSKALQMTASWYKAFYENQRIQTEIQIDEYIDTAAREELAWIR